MELKPCLCQSNILIVDELITFSVHCLDCGAYGPVRATEEEAVAAWNRRPTEDALRAENERLKQEIADALDVQYGNGPTALEMVFDDRNALRKRVGELEGLVEEAFKEGVRTDERVADSALVHDEWLLSDAYEALTPPATEEEAKPYGPIVLCPHCKRAMHPAKKCGHCGWTKAEGEDES